MSLQANIAVPNLAGTAVAQMSGAFQAIIPGVSQTVAISGTSAQSAAFGALSTIVRVAVNTDAWIKFGANPTADKTTSIFMPSGSIEYFGVTPGQKVAGLQDSASGNMVITEGL